MDNKGFTLIELIFVILILGVILAFSLPNISSTLQKNKKDQMIVDAKDMVEKTKTYMLTYSAYPTASDSDKKREFFLKDIDPREEIKTSPYGLEYDRDVSKVTVTYVKNSGLVTYKYEIVLQDKNTTEQTKNNKLESTLEDLNSSDKYDIITVN